MKSKRKMKSKLFIEEIMPGTYAHYNDGRTVEVNKGFQDKFDEWYNREFVPLDFTREVEVEEIKFSTLSSGAGHGPYYCVVLVLYHEFLPET